MSYYANAYGRCILISEFTDDIRKIVEKSFDDFSVYDNEINFEAYRNYHEEEVYAFCDAIKPFVKNCVIEFHGEDETYWRFIYDPDRKTFSEENGHIVYEPERERTKLIDQIIAAFNTHPAKDAAGEIAAIINNWFSE